MASARVAGGLLAVAGSRCLVDMVTGRDASAMSVGSPMMDTDVVLVHAFSDAINARDLARLEALMRPEHRFVDTAGTTVSGRAECLAAWAAFFTSFPDYRNVFERIDVVVPGRVTATGYSRCTVEPLGGPAIWRVVVVDGSILEWRVDDSATPQQNGS